MPDKKEVKRFHKDLTHAIEWAAAEFKYIKELKEELEEIKKEKDVKKEIKEISKAIRILRYVGRAERRAARFEGKVEGDLKEIYKDLSEHLEFDFSEKKAIMDLIRELEIEHNALVKYTSIYEGLLKEELTKAEAEAQLLADIEGEEPKKADKIHSVLMELISKVQKQIADAEKWVSALEASLKKAEETVGKLPEKEMFAKKIHDLILDEKLVSHSTYGLFHKYKQGTINSEYIKAVLGSIFKYGLIARGSPLREKMARSDPGFGKGYGPDFQADAFAWFILPYLLYDVSLRLGAEKSALDEFIVRKLTKGKIKDKNEFLRNLSIQRTKVFWNEFVEKMYKGATLRLRQEKKFPWLRSKNDLLKKEMENLDVHLHSVMSKSGENENFFIENFVSNTPSKKLKRSFLEHKKVFFAYDEIGFLIYKPDFNRTPFLSEKEPMCSMDYLIYNQIKSKEFAALILPKELYLLVKEVIPKGLSVVTADLKLLRK